MTLKNRVGNRTKALIVILLVISAAVFAFLNDSLLDHIDTEGIRSIKIQKSMLQNEEWILGDSFLMTFDATGNILLESRHSNDGTLVFSYQYDYDESGNLTRSEGKRMISGELEEFEYHYTYDEYGNQTEGVKTDLEGAVLSKYTARYDAAGNFIEGNDFPESGNKTRYLATYDEMGNLLQEAKHIVYEYKGEEKLQREYVYFYNYDDSGNVVEEWCLDRDDTVLYRYTYAYDADGNVVKAENSDAQNVVQSIYEARYDSRGNLEEFTLKDAQGNIIKHHGAKFEGRNILQEFDYAESTPKILSEFSYDHKGNLTEETRFDENVGGMIISYRYSYSYDDKDNCILSAYSVLKEDGTWQMVSRTEFQIEYL